MPGLPSDRWRHRIRFWSAGFDRGNIHVRAPPLDREDTKRTSLDGHRRKKRPIGRAVSADLFRQYALQSRQSPVGSKYAFISASGYGLLLVFESMKHAIDASSRCLGEMHPRPVLDTSASRPIIVMKSLDPDRRASIRPIHACNGGSSSAHGPIPGSRHPHRVTRGTIHRTAACDGQPYPRLSSPERIVAGL
jgi:hypothetical protein